mgnify:CR=1 FL=1
MFAKTINRETGHATLYECDRVVFNRLLKDDETITVDFESEKDCVTTILDRRASELYIMNDEGKTIDSYQWFSYEKSPLDIYQTNENK